MPVGGGEPHGGAAGEVMDRRGGGGGAAVTVGAGDIDQNVDVELGHAATQHREAGLIISGADVTHRLVSP
ncbi:hypothetical protein GCM10029964_052640 [Kibdelosporangium lantanae]